MELNLIIIIVVAAILIVGTLMALMSRYKRCPSDQLLVVYGKTSGTSTGLSSKVYHGGGKFIYPIIQDFAFIDLKPMALEIKLSGALTSQNIRIDVPSTFTIAVSNNETDRNTAAERLLGLDRKAIAGLAQDIILGGLRLVIASMTIESINSDRDKFLTSIQDNLETELKKVGLKLINVNITDIKDESGYIDALGKEAAAGAINNAKISVAQKDRDGSIGQKDAQREQRVRLAELDAATQIGEAEFKTKKDVESADYDAKTIEGKNIADVKIAESNSVRQVKESEAKKLAETAQAQNLAKTQEDTYKAQTLAEKQRAIKEKESQLADIIVPAEIAKQKTEVDAEAEAERERRIAQGKADGILSMAKAHAEGEAALLIEQAKGFNAIVESAKGNVEHAIQLMMVEKVEKIAKYQYDALANIKIDKITVWDSGNGSGGTGSATPDFMKGFLTTLPGMDEVFRDLGLQLPKIIDVSETSRTKEEIAKSEASEMEGLKSDPRKEAAKAALANKAKPSSNGSNNRK